jgi:hypothetical protein
MLRPYPHGSTDWPADPNLPASREPRTAAYSLSARLRRRVTLRPELVLLNLDCGHTAFRTHYPAPRHEFQRDRAVQLRRPAYGQLHPPAGNQESVRRKQDTVAAHVYGLSRARFIFRLAIQHLVAYVTLDRKPV